MMRRTCTKCPHPEYLHNDRLAPTGACQIEGCSEHLFSPVKSVLSHDQERLF